MLFFARQSLLRRQSYVALAALVLVLICMAMAIHVAVVAFDRLVGGTTTWGQPALPALVLIGIVWTAVALGMLFRYLDIRSGGAVLARRYGAVQASDRARHKDERNLMRVVAEMAIASSTPQPDVYVLRSEHTINAFVLGSFSGANTIVVTQGALTHLDRDELQAVVAHEFGHISQGDVPRNMLLLMIIGGLHAIDDIGRTMVELSDNFALIFFVLLGYPMRAFGQIGVLGAGIVRAAFSRRREYLADTMSVQYTRNPDGLASALAVIKFHPHQYPLRIFHVDEIAHSCLHLNSPTQWWRRLLATHPPIKDRILAINPYFYAEDWQTKRDEQLAHGRVYTLQEGSAVPGYIDYTSPTDSPGGGGASKPELHSRPGAELPMHVAMAAVLPTMHSVAAIGQTSVPELTPMPEAISVSDATSALSADPAWAEPQVSDRIALLLQDDSSCLAVLFALFASENVARRDDFLSAAGFAYNAEFAAKVREMLDTMKEELATEQKALINHVTAYLRSSLSREELARVLQTLEKLLLVEDEHNVWHYATLQLLRRQLDADFPVLESIADRNGRSANARRVKRFDEMGQEFALLLSLMVEASGAEPAELDAEFQRVLACYTQAKHPRRIANEPGIIFELEAAFQTLYVQPLPIRKAFVKHCVEIMEKDGHVARAERSLLDLFAASLGCAA